MRLFTNKSEERNVSPSPTAEGPVEGFADSGQGGADINKGKKGMKLFNDPEPALDEKNASPSTTEEGSVEGVADSNQESADVNALDEEGMTSLIRAVLTDDIEAMRALIKAGAHVNAVEKKTGSTALHFASLQGNEGVIQVLLAAGADVNAKTTAGLKARDVAMLRGYTEIAQALFSIEQASMFGNGVEANAKPQDQAQVEGGQSTSVSMKQRTNLLSAAKYNDLESLDALLAEGVDVNETTKTGMTTALHLASLNGHNDVVKKLLAAGADMSAEDDSFRTPSMCAASAGRLAVMKTLLDAGDDVNNVNVNGTALMWAAENGRLKAVQMLFEHGADLRATNSCGWTALMKASFGGHEKTVGFLLQSGAEIDVVNKDGRTALMCSTKGRVTRLLLRSGAEVNRKDKDGLTALHIAVQEYLIDVVRALLAKKETDVNAVNKNGETPLHIAVDKGLVDVMRELLKTGANPNSNCVTRFSWESEIGRMTSITGGAEGKNGFTTLHIAALRNRVLIGWELIQAGADVEAKDASGTTALMNAGTGGCLEFVQMLIDDAKVKNVNAKDKDGRTALMFAVWWRDCVEMVSLLVNAGAEVEARDKNGMTVLMLAFAKNRTGVASWLVGIGADVKARDADEVTMLHLAALWGSFVMVSMLIRRGLDVNAKDKMGNTPLDLASSQGHLLAVQALVKAGADVNAADANGVTPLMRAMGGKHDDVAQALCDVGADLRVKDKEGHTAMFWGKSQKPPTLNLSLLLAMALEDSLN